MKLLFLYYYCHPYPGCRQTEHQIKSTESIFCRESGHNFLRPPWKLLLRLLGINIWKIAGYRHILADKGAGYSAKLLPIFFRDFVHLLLHLGIGSLPLDWAFLVFNLLWNILQLRKINVVYERRYLMFHFKVESLV